MHALAEIGVILLLFSIGLEFSLSRLLRIWKIVLYGGGLQVLLVVLSVTIIMNVFEWNFTDALFVGFLASLSSTAIVMKIFYDRGELNTPHGKISLGILLFQDLCFIPMMLLLPFLAGKTDGTVGSVITQLSFTLIAVIGIIIVVRFVMPWILEHVMRSRNREMVVLVTIFFSLGTASLTSYFGLSFALGAFIAGLGLAESEYRFQIIAEAATLRDALGSLFFISLGMLFNISYIIADPIPIISYTFLLQLLKISVVILVVFLLKNPIRIAILSGLALAQVGEFSFILAQVGSSLGLLNELFYQNFYAVTLISMLMTPLLIRFAPQVGVEIQKYSKIFLDEKEASIELNEKSLHDHVIILGYGLNGKNVATVLKETGIPYVILEINIDRFRQGKSDGEPIIYGDGTRETILKQIGISKARTLVVAISDPISTNQIVKTARRLNSNMYIIVRTRYLAEIDELYQTDANEVITEEFETSIEIFTRVLRQYHVPRNVIQLQVDLLRREGYSMMRGLKLPDTVMSQLESILTAGTTDNFLVLSDSPACGKSLLELDLRRKTGASIIVIVRNDKPITNPQPDVQIEKGDILILLGTHAEVDKAFDLLSSNIAEK
ncbi:MAG: cation:proton antiporter [Ignavibacteriales bacterium]|nr:cation:proton antiporter [Ignavibacteriales bacterium]